MALQKQSIPLNFSQGLDTKTDPFQVPLGKFLGLSNAIFSKSGLLQKRNGFASLADLPDATNTYTTTYNGNLTAIGSTLNAYSNGSNTWVTRGTIQPVSLDTLSLIRSNLSQTQCDSAVAANGLVCVVFTDTGGSVSPEYKYAIADSTTGQNIVAPTVIAALTGTVTGSPRVFVLGNYFMIVFSNNVGGTYHLQYIAVNTVKPTIVTAATDISTQYTPANTVAWDGVVANNSLYLAWNGSDGGGAIRMSYIDSTLLQHNTVAFSGRVATIMSVTADISGNTPVIYATFYDSGASTGYILAVNQILSTVHAPTQWLATGTILNVTTAAQNAVCTIFYEVSNAYSYDSGIASNFVKTRTCTQGGVLGSAVVMLRSVGIASKAFIYNDNEYLLLAYSSAYQPTYFLANSSGNVIAKLAYSNGGGYLTRGLPSVSIVDDIVNVSYLFKDLLIPVNKTQGAQNSGLGVYSQTGINLAKFDITTSGLMSAEIGNDLHLSGGFLWMYDGYLPVEHNFFLWPDNVEATWSATGGSIHAQPDGSTNTNAYYYVATYEWSDNQGNIFRSAPSIPVGVTTTSNGTTGSITVNIPTLRLTYKTANPVKIVLYRWSAGQETYYQVTSVTAPTLNDTSTDSIAYVDTLADASIIGNSILYTTGGVVENIGAPSTSVMALYKSRLFLVDAEDKNLLWFSKQVIEATPVEMSDLLTIYVAPTTAAQGNTGPMLALGAMDDKLIIFKKDAIYYLTGTGPDNTGANNDFSEPVFITSTVGCANNASIVFVPKGLLFQSDKGIWLLGRDLSTSYIGAPVEKYNQYTVKSALNIPATNQVRFTLSNGVTLMYDYYYDQWGTFDNVPAVSSTLYQDLHTFINAQGRVFQESPGLYLDGSSPVLLSFTTSWINLAGLQGYQRAYFFYLLGTYVSPHKLSIGIAYDYNSSPQQTVLISPNNYNPNFGDDPIYGSASPFGGNPALEQWRVFLSKQRCQSFQIVLNEYFDPSFGAPCGQGLTLSGLNLVVAVKSGWPTLPAAQSAS